MCANELYHHGIKGMHWGVRRYQNPDGTYTSAGKARYGNSSSGSSRATSTKNRKQFISDAKNALTSKTAKKIYKGAAITAGVLATGYAANMTMQEVENHKNYKRAKELTDGIIDKYYRKHPDEQKEIIRQMIMTKNMSGLVQNSTERRNARKQAITEHLTSYMPGQSANRNVVRTKRAAGLYKVSKLTDDRLMNKNNISKDMLRELGTRALEQTNPAEYRRRVDNRAKAEREKEMAKEAAERKRIEKENKKQRKRDAKLAKQMEKKQRRAMRDYQDAQDREVERGRKISQANSEFMRAQAELIRAQRGY